MTDQDRRRGGVEIFLMWTVKLIQQKALERMADHTDISYMSAVEDRL